jgi:hypothetical protein
MNRAGRRTMLSMVRIAAADAAMIFGCAAVGAASGCAPPQYTYLAMVEYDDAAMWEAMAEIEWADWDDD